MKHKILSFSLLIAFSGLANAGEKTGDLKSSATIQATCLISTDSIGFGTVATPLMMQSAQSDMTVKCSNSTAYTIDLAYGGIYGQGGESLYKINFSSYGSTYNTYLIYSNAGVFTGSITCGYGSDSGKVMFGNATIANMYGTPYVGGFQNNTHGACISNNTKSGTFPKGWVGLSDAAGKQPIGGKAGYDYGVMNGISKGDKLAYSIQVPNEPSKAWNSGLNSYKSTGNGNNQTIPMIAKIVPDKSGSKYPAPDMYLDTVTAIISY